MVAAAAAMLAARVTHVLSQYVVRQLGGFAVHEELARGICEEMKSLKT